MKSQLDDETGKFNENKSLINYIINNKLHNANPNIYDDLYQLGSIGLLKAIRTYNPDKECAFTTYACKCIYNEIAQFFRKIKNDISCQSLNSIVCSNDGDSITELCDIVIDHNNIDMDIIFIRDIIAKEFNDRDKKVIKLYLYGYKQREISSAVNISHQHVSRIITRFRSYFV